MSPQDNSGTTLLDETEVAQDDIAQGEFALQPAVIESVESGKLPTPKAIEQICVRAGRPVRDFHRLRGELIKRRDAAALYASDDSALAELKAECDAAIARLNAVQPGDAAMVQGLYRDKIEVAERYRDEAYRQREKKSAAWKFLQDTQNPADHETFRDLSNARHAAGVPASALRQLLEGLKFDKRRRRENKDRIFDTERDLARAEAAYRVANEKLDSFVANEMRDWRRIDWSL